MVYKNVPMLLLYLNVVETVAVNFKRTPVGNRVTRYQHKKIMDNELPVDVVGAEITIIYTYCSFHSKVMRETTLLNKRRNVFDLSATDKADQRYFEPPRHHLSPLHSSSTRPYILLARQPDQHQIFFEECFLIVGLRRAH
jgi:hypothetical protein